MRHSIRCEMDRLAGELLRSLRADPDGFDARDELWQRREHLRAELAAL